MSYDWRLSTSEDIATIVQGMDMADERRTRELLKPWVQRPEPRAVFPPARPRMPVLANGMSDWTGGERVPAPASDSAFDHIVSPGLAGTATRALAAAVGVSTTVVFIDAAVADISAIVRAASTDAEIVSLDETSDGLAQIAAYLEERTGIEVIHIVGAGEPGELRLGCAAVTCRSIREEHAGSLAAVRGALTAEADLIVYGGDVMVSTLGEAFKAALAMATGASVLTAERVVGDAGKHQAADPSDMSPVTAGGAVRSPGRLVMRGAGLAG